MDINYIDFILENAYIPIYGIAFIISLLRYTKYKGTSLRYFPIILAYTLFNEVIGRVLEYQYDLWWLYNLYNLAFFLFFYYAFWRQQSILKFKTWIKYCAILLFFTSLINPFFQNFVSEPQLFAYIFGSVMLIFCIILFYLEILNTSKVLLIGKDLLFWSSVGLLLFYVGYIPIKLTRYFFATLSADTFVVLRRVHLLLILVMYSCFIIGFLWTRKKLQD